MPKAKKAYAKEIKERVYLDQEEKDFYFIIEFPADAVNEFKKYKEEGRAISYYRAELSVEVKRTMFNGCIEGGYEVYYLGYDGEFHKVISGDFGESKSGNVAEIFGGLGINIAKIHAKSGYVLTPDGGTYPCIPDYLDIKINLYVTYGVG